MIKATELRLGNIVNDIWTEVVGIHSSETIMLLRSPHHPEGQKIIPKMADQLIPVPITEEILLKFGFNVDEDFKFRFILELVGINEHVQCLLVGIKGANDLIVRYTVNKHWASLDLKYIHQIQNFIFDFTGKEAITGTV